MNENIKMTIEEEDDETLLYLETPENQELILIEDEEEIIDYDIYDFIKDPNININAINFETFVYRHNFLKQLAHCHNKKLTDNNALLFETIRYMSMNNGKCMPTFFNGINYICPCKSLKEQNVCPKKLFID